MTPSFSSLEEQARLKAVRASTYQERKDDAALAVVDWQRAARAREANTARLKALRLAAQDIIIAGPPSDPAKPKRKTLRPGQSSNTRRVISG